MLFTTNKCMSVSVICIISSLPFIGRSDKNRGEEANLAARKGG